MKTSKHEETQWSVSCPQYNCGRCASSGYDNPHTNCACNKRKGARKQQRRYNDRKESRSGRYKKGEKPVDNNNNKLIGELFEISRPTDCRQDNAHKTLDFVDDCVEYANLSTAGALDMLPSGVGDAGEKQPLWHVSKFNP